MYLEVSHCAPYTKNIMMNKVRCLQFREESKKKGKAESTIFITCHNNQDLLIEPVLCACPVLSIVSNSINPRR